MQRIRLAAACLGALAVCAPSARAADAASASFLVVHGIPGRDVGATLDPLLPVDVLVNGSLCLLHGLNFGSIAGPFDVPAGTYTVAVSLANPLAPCSNAAVISGSVTLAAGEFGAVVAALSTAGAPTAEVYPIDVSPVGAGKQRLVVAHAADAPAVDVIASSGGPDPETLRVPLAPGKEAEAAVFARPGFSVEARAGSTVLGPVRVDVGAQGVVFGVAVGSAKTGSAILLTKVLPSVF